MAKLDEIITQKGFEEQNDKIKANLKKLNVREESGETISRSTGKRRPYYNVRLITDPTNRGIILNREEAIEVGIGYDNLALGIRRESYDPTTKYHLALAAYHNSSMSIDDSVSLLFENIRNIFANEGTLAQEVLQDAATRGRLAQHIADYARSKVSEEVDEARRVYSKARQGLKNKEKERRDVNKQIRGLYKQIKSAKSKPEDERPEDYASWVKEKTQYDNKVKKINKEIPQLKDDLKSQEETLKEQRLNYLGRALAYATVASQPEKVEKMYQHVPVTPQSETSTLTSQPMEENSNSLNAGRKIGKHTIYR